MDTLSAQAGADTTFWALLHDGCPSWEIQERNVHRRQGGFRERDQLQRPEAERLLKEVSLVCVVRHLEGWIASEECAPTVLLAFDNSQ